MFYYTKATNFYHSIMTKLINQSKMKRNKSKNKWKKHYKMHLKLNKNSLVKWWKR